MHKQFLRTQCLNPSYTVDPDLYSSKPTLTITIGIEKLKLNFQYAEFSDPQRRFSRTIYGLLQKIVTS